MTRQTRVGLAMVLGFGIVLWLGIAKPNPFRSTKTVWAMFRDATTITSVDRNVRIGGADVGTIGSVERVGDAAKVQLILDDPSIRVAADATAELRPHLAFEGNSFIQLDPGSPSAPELGDRVIPLSQTTNYVSVDKLLRVANAPTRTALTQDLARLADDLQLRQQQSLQRFFHALPQLYTTLAPAARAALGRNGNELAGAVSGVAATFHSVAREEGSLVPLLRGGQLTFAAFDTQAGAALDRTLAELPPTLTALQSGGQALNGIVQQLNPTAQALQPALQQLAPAEHELRPLLRALRPVLAGARPVVASLRTALDSGERAAAPSLSLLNGLRPIVKPLDKTVVPALLAPTSLGAPVYQEAFRGLLAGYDGAIGPTQTKQSLDTALGIGPGFRFNATVFTVPINGLPPKCSALPQTVELALEQLKLCAP